MKRTPINSQSQKRRAVSASRAQCRQTVLERAQGRCEAQLGGLCTRAASDVHEVKTRARGGSITDPDNCLALCRACHSYITDHPAFADRWGFTVHAWATEADYAEAEYRRGQAKVLLIEP